MKTTPTWCLAVTLAALLAGVALAQDAAPSSGSSPAPRTGTGDPGSDAPRAASSEAPIATDAMVTLPLSEFEALLHSGSGSSLRRGPPASWTLRESSYACEALDDGAVRVTAALKIDVLSGGYQAIPIGGGDVVFEKAKLDGADVLLVAADAADRSAVLVPTPGAHTLDVAFIVSAPADPSGSRRMAFGIARSPLNRVVLSLAKEPTRVQAVGGIIATTAKRGARTEIQMQWPASDQVAVVWTEPVPAPTTAPSAAPPVVAPRVEAQMISRYSFRPDRMDVDAQAVISVRQGTLAEVAVHVPAGLRILRVREQNGETTPPYTTTANATGTLLTIRPAEPITGEKRFHLEVARTLPASVPLTDNAGPTASASASAVALPVSAGQAAPTDGTSATASPPALPGATDSTTVAVPSVASSAPATAPATSVVATTATSAPPPLPAVSVPLAFLTLPGIPAASGEFSLAYPATPLTMDLPEPQEPVRRSISLTTGALGGPSFAYTGTPSYVIQLRAVRTQAQAPVSVPELRARTLLLPEGALVTRATWIVVNRRQATFNVSLPPRAEILTALVDGEPVRLGLLQAGSTATARGPEVRLPGTALPATDASTAVATPGFAVPLTDPTTPPWVDVAVPLRQDPDRPANLELTYRQPLSPLGWRDRVPLQLARTPGDVTQLRWDLYVPPGFIASASSNTLRVGDAHEARSVAAAPAATAAASLDAARTTTGVVRFEMPEPISGTRIPLATDSLKSGTPADVELATVSLGFQQIVRTVVFLLTLLALADLYWLSFGSAVTIGLGVALAGTVLAGLLLGLSVMGQVVAGVVAALTFKLMRLLLDPVEEKETP